MGYAKNGHGQSMDGPWTMSLGEHNTELTITILKSNS